MNRVTRWFKNLQPAAPRTVVPIHEPAAPLLVWQGDIHEWFELSYAQYLTVPRSVLEAMPLEWQQRFVRCLVELDETFAWRPEEGRYWCRLKDQRGRFAHDPLMEYRRPNFEHLEKIRRRPDAACEHIGPNDCPRCEV